MFELEVIRLAEVFASRMVEKSGVQEWNDTEFITKVSDAARQMAERIVYGASELMAVSKTLLQEMDGTPKQIVFADHAGDFSPTAANDLRKTTDGSHELDAEWNPASLANGAYYQSAKVDLGEHRAEWYKARIAVELAATPTAGNTIDLYWAPSQSGTAGTGNPGAVSGAKGAYTGYSSNAAAAIKQLDFIGSAVLTAQATGTIQVAEIQTPFSPTERYGSLVVLNGAGSAFHSDDAEIHVVLDPQVSESQ